MKDVRFLAELLKNNIKIRVAQKPFTVEGSSYDRGSLIITMNDNRNVNNFLDVLQEISKKHFVTLNAVDTGFVEEGKDFGSRSVQMLPNVKVAVLSGEPASTLRFGEIWHFFEQQLNYPLTVIDGGYLDRIDLSKYDVLILPDGRGYRRFITDDRLKKLKEWVANGGKLIAMGEAIRNINGENGFGIKERKTEKDSIDHQIQKYEETQRESIKNSITGAIFKVKVDNTHPLGYGYGDSYFTLKLGDDSYDYLKNGTVAYLETTRPVAGFAGSEARKKLDKTLVFGVESHGRGNVIFMVDNPLFRGFWENGKLFFANALFMVK